MESSRAAREKEKLLEFPFGRRMRTLTAGQIVNNFYL